MVRCKGGLIRNLKKYVAPRRFISSNTNILLFTKGLATKYEESSLILNYCLVLSLDCFNPGLTHKNEVKIIISILVFCISINLAHSYNLEQQDSVKIPNVKRIKGGGRGDGTGGGGVGRRTESANVKALKSDQSSNSKQANIEQADSMKVLQWLKKAEKLSNSNLDSAFQYANQALILSQRVQYENGIIDCQIKLTKLYESNGNPQKAIELYKFLLNSANDNSRLNRVSIIIKLAVNHQILKVNSEAEYYWNLAVEQLATDNDTIGLISTYMDFGRFYDGNQSYDKALKSLQSGLTLSKQVNNHVAISTTLGVIGNVYAHKGQFDKAIEFLNESLELKKVNYRPVSVAYGYYHLQQAYYEAGEYETSIDYGEKVQFTLNGNPGTLLYKQSLRSFKSAHEKIGKEMSELTNSSLFTLFDSLKSHERMMHVRQLKTIHNTQKTNEYIYTQRDEIGTLAALTEWQQALIGYVVIGLLAVFGGIMLYRSKAFAVKERKIQEVFSQQLLSYQEDERQRISRDLHDSIGQSLVLIKNKVQLDNDKTTSNMIADTLEEVRNISKQLHPALLEKLGLTASIKKLAEEADKNSDIFFDIQLSNIDAIFPKENELHIYRILQEAVNNLVKHSQTPSASIITEELSNNIKISVIDYGKGFDLTENASQFQSLGMLTLKERTKILNGRLSIDSTKGKGTSITLMLNKPAS